jgi:hypothetical protein
MARHLSIAMLLAGTMVGTYAYTRYSTTSAVLTTAGASAGAFLQEEGYFPGEDESKPFPAEDKFSRGRMLILQISLAGGMYYGWNELLPYYGITVFLLVTGVLLPFVRSRPAGSKPQTAGSD